MLHPHHQSHPMHGMPMCHLDFPKMQAALPSQLYASNAFEGSVLYASNAFEGILEIRKEKSRDAARSRRGKENYEFYELAKMLPLPGAITSQLDKASIIRLTISYLKLKDFSCHGDPPWHRDLLAGQNKAVPPPRRRNPSTELYEAHIGTHILQSLDGFVFALSNDGRFLYISETVSIYLGLSQVEMTGSSIFDYIHYEDHRELAEQLGLSSSTSSSSSSGTTRFSSSSSTNDDKDDGSDSSSRQSPPPRSSTPSITERASIMNPSPSKGYERCFCIRMKSTLTKRGVHVKCSGYRVVQVLARMRPQFSFSLTRKHTPPLLGLVAMAIALPPPTITELVIDSDMFVTRLSPELKIIYCEPRINDMMDMCADDMTNRNLYEYCHAEDLQKLKKAHVDLMTKGQVLTDYYRLMNKHGGYVWLQTCATIICHSKNAEEQNIIAINYVLSGIEHAGCVMNMEQYKVVSPHSEPDHSDHSESEPLLRDKGSRDMKNPTSQDGSRPPSSKRWKGSGSVHPGDGLSLQPTDDESGSPQDGGGVYRTAMEGFAMFSSEEARLKQLDNKNSRRKMDKPRKRKKDLESETDDRTDNQLTDPASPCKETAAPVSVISSVLQNTNAPVSPPPDMAAKVCSPLPEDLSIRVASPVTAQSPPRHPSLTPTISSEPSTWVGQQATDSSAQIEGSSSAPTSSVRDLEEAMNKHLPSLQPAPVDQDPYRVMHGDYSMLEYQKQKSNIQWSGGNNTTGGGGGAGVTPDTLPATNLLRSLYASRETVIRPNIYNPRPQYYNDSMQNSLLTPPGGATDPYKDSFSVPQSKTPPSSYSLMGGYTSSPISVACMSNGMTDTYSMTPPSSVSPQEKYGTVYGNVDGELRYDNGLASMPIKPHAYPLPAHANSHMAAYERSVASAAAAQYPSTGYYGTTAGFSAYNHTTSPTPAHYRDGKTGNVW